MRDRGRALAIALALASNACSVAVTIPELEPAEELKSAPEPLGSASVYFAPAVLGYILEDPGPPPISTRTYKAALGPALLEPLKDACAPLFSKLSPVSTRDARQGDPWLLSFDTLVVRSQSGENDPCRVRIFLQYAVIDSKGRAILEGLLDATGVGTEHQGALRYSESLGTAIRRSIEKLGRDLRKTLAARRGTFEDRRPETAKASPG